MAPDKNIQMVTRKRIKIKEIKRIETMTTNSQCNKTVIQSFRLKQTIGIAILS